MVVLTFRHTISVYWMKARYLILKNNKEEATDCFERVCLNDVHCILFQAEILYNVPKDQDHNVLFLSALTDSRIPTRRGRQVH